MTIPPLIDAHVHLWEPQRLRYSWLDSVPDLNRPFLPEAYQRASLPVNVEKIVIVEGACEPSQSLAEVSWITELARKNSQIKGMVAYAPLEQGAAARSELDALARCPLVKGVRRILQGEGDPEFCTRPGFIEGVRLLAEYGYSYDLCLFPGQLPAVIKLVRQCPSVSFILDHAGKPAIRDQVLEPWKQNLRALAAQPNVCCKLSGLVTEADHRHWQREQLRPYVDWVVACFGFDRIIFGSDWPVLLLASDYARWLGAVRWAVDGASESELQKLFHDNAERIYRLDN